jgi:DNA-damage-inducible protein D
MANERQPPPPEEHQSPFELIRRTNEAGRELWSSRDFAQSLNYTGYRNFEQVIQKARMACFNSRQPIKDHFVDVTDMIEIGKGGRRAVAATLLSRIF